MNHCLTEMMGCPEAGHPRCFILRFSWDNLKLRLQNIGSFFPLYVVSREEVSWGVWYQVPILYMWKWLFRALICEMCVSTNLCFASFSMRLEFSFFFLIVWLRFSIPSCCLFLVSLENARENWKAFLMFYLFEISRNIN